MDEVAKVLINKTPGRFTINFMGAFPNNKWTAKKNGKIYLTDREWEWVQTNIPHIIEKGLLVVEGSKQEKEVNQNEQNEINPEAFFKQHHAKAKSQISKMTNLDDINKLIDYANDNELEGSVVDALVERANQLGE